MVKLPQQSVIETNSTTGEPGRLLPPTFLVPDI